jgi:hypothetical protein
MQDIDKVWTNFREGRREQKNMWSMQPTELGTSFKQWLYVCLGATAWISIVIAQYV